MSRNTPGNIYRQLDLTRRRNGRVNANPDHDVFRVTIVHPRTLIRREDMPRQVFR